MSSAESNSNEVRAFVERFMESASSFEPFDGPPRLLRWAAEERGFLLETHETLQAMRAEATQLYTESRAGWELAEVPPVLLWGVAEQLLDDSMAAARSDADEALELAEDALSIVVEGEPGLAHAPAILPFPRCPNEESAPLSYEILGQYHLLRGLALATCANAHRIKAQLFLARERRDNASAALLQGRAQLARAARQSASYLSEDLFGYGIRARLLLVSVNRALRDSGAAQACLELARTDLEAVREIAEGGPERPEGAVASRTVAALAPRFGLLEASLRVVEGDLLGAMLANERALAAMTETDTEPLLWAVAAVNSADFLSRIEGTDGREAALRVVEQVADVVHAAGGEVNVLRLRAIQARAMQDPESMLAACEGFVRIGASYDAALVLLEVAALFLQEGQPERCAPLVTTAGAVLAVNGIAAETVAAVALFASMVRTETVRSEALHSLEVQLRAI